MSNVRSHQANSEEAQMLTKSQADAVADALVEGNKAERIGRLEAGAARIPHYYRSQYLSRVPAWRQTQLVAEAQRTAGFTWLAAGIVACMLLLVAVLWFSSEHSRSLSALWPVVPVIGAFSALFRVLLVKLRLQDLLLQELLPQQGDGI
jgi:hypothetical protein